MTPNHIRTVTVSLSLPSCSHSDSLSMLVIAVIACTLTDERQGIVLGFCQSCAKANYDREDIVQNHSHWHSDMNDNPLWLIGTNTWLVRRDRPGVWSSATQVIDSLTDQPIVNINEGSRFRVIIRTQFITRGVDSPLTMTEDTITYYKTDDVVEC